MNPYLFFLLFNTLKEKERMKRLTITWIGLLCLTAALWAQKGANSGFLFDQFTDGIVYYRDGKQFGVPLNYNFLTRQFVFVDKKDDNRQKEFSEPALIVAIEIDGRTFLPPSEGATEIIQSEPPFYVSYTGTIKSEKSVAYGGTTQTASVDAYSQVRGVGQLGGADGAERSLASINKEYRIKIGKKNKRFSTSKQFLKLFPLQKEALTRYLEEQPVDFNNTAQVLELYRYACRSGQ